MIDLPPPETVRPARVRPVAAGLHALNRVPAITLYFWVIKILCTTVGETAADFLNEDLHLGLIVTTLIMAVLLLIAVVLQFRARRYVPAIYWLVLVSVSVVGTLITDNLSDNIGVPLAVSTLSFAAALATTFALWSATEKTLSIRTIVSSRREAFYWVAVLLTFAFGTAAGDWLAEGLALGYLKSALVFAALIGAVVIAHQRLRLNAVVAFWIAYVLTRPLGASVGDYLSQSPDNGGLGWGTTTTSVVFLGGIVAAVMYLTVTKRDVIVAA